MSVQPNLTTGRCDFFTKEQMDNKMFPVRASAALPLFSHIFYLNNQPYLDGGIACRFRLHHPSTTETRSTLSS